MKDLNLVLVAALLTAGAAPLFAAPRRCANGNPPKLSGDVFSPVECSSATLTAPMLPDLPIRPNPQAKTDLRDVDGRWEGDLYHAMGRYALLLTIKTGWNGKTEVVLDTQERQFRERLTDRLTLTPGKQRGSYEAVMTTSVVPDASLKGGALVGAAAEPELSTPTAKAPAERQMDLLFDNGAAHRLIFSLKGKNELLLRAFSGIPGAPLQKFELTLARTKREAL